MKRVPVFCLFLVAGIVSACHRPLSAPEQVDPIYQDLRAQTDKVVSSIVENQKNLEKAKLAFDHAPIRMGQRQDTMEDYFQAQHKMEELIEKYRLLALKTQRQRKEDRISYQKAFQDKKPWPNPDDIALYKVQRRLKDAPREWDPDKRIKGRIPAAASEKAENKEKKE